MINKLRQQAVNPQLLEEVIAFNKNNTVEDQMKARIPKDQIIYLGKDIWEQAITACLQGANLLLVGPKSTGKNLLASNLAMLFNRPSWNVSLNMNTDENQLLGADTFINNEVVFRPGPITQASQLGGFCVLDEINMAKNEALSILHATLDDRRILDIPGQDLINLHEKTRFIATMNYGYLGTRDLNEALVSRFMVIDMPQIQEEYLNSLLSQRFPSIRSDSKKALVHFFKDLELKVEHAEISSRAMDLRGLLSAIDATKYGLSLQKALNMGITNKAFDSFEQELINDLIRLNFPKELTKKEIFDDTDF